MLKDMVLKSRSIRRFDQTVAVTPERLRELVDLARLTPSGANLQPLRYILAWKVKKCALIFPHIGWAAYLKDWAGPEEGERPSAYIIIVGDRDRSKSFGVDHGIAAQTIMLGAVEQGLGGCMIGSFKGKALAEALKLPERYEILLVLALGKPREEVVIDRVGEDGSIKYWRDAEGVHHVPKRDLDQLLLDY